MINTLFLWAAIFITALLIEAGAPGLFYFLSLAIGSGTAAAMSYFCFSFTTQLAACFLASCVALLALRYLVLQDKTTRLKTNASALIGQRTVVIESVISGGTGRVKIYGDVWLVREKDGQGVPAGQEVTVIDVQGCHLIVRKNN